MHRSIGISVRFVFFLRGLLFLKEAFFLVDSDMGVDLFLVISFIGNDTQNDSQNNKCNEEHSLLFGVKCRDDEDP